MKQVLTAVLCSSVWMACGDAGDFPSDTSEGKSVERTEQALTASAPRTRQQAVGDFTGDGFADCAVEDLSTGTFVVYPNLRNGKFASTPTGGGRVNNWANEETFVADFTGDHFADFADHLNEDGSPGLFLIYRNHQDATFTNTSTWGSGQSTTGSNWETLIGDFTGDGFADYADHNLSNGGFWVHKNRGDGSFDGWGINSGHGTTKYGSGWETLVADFTGDGFADYADHNLTTGEFWIHENLKNELFAEPGTTGAIWGYGKSTVTAPYVTLVGDFTGDKLADYIDYNTTTGDFWIHANLGNGGFAGYGQNWGSGRCPNWLGYALPAASSGGGGGGSNSGGPHPPQ